MSRTHRFFNMYLTSTISVSLVLFLVGLLAVLILAASTVIDKIKENVTLTVVLNEKADTTSLHRFEKMLDAAPFCNGYEYISREQALEEHISNLGEDPAKFLGYNPLSDSYEIHPNAQYAHPDSVEAIDERISKLPYVDRVIYQRDVLELMNSNLNDAAIILLGAALILLFIALALIVNTIRLQIYAKRFIINTMSLVGATAWIIQRPFIRKNVTIGIVASLMALSILSMATYYVNYRLGVLLFPLTWQNITFVCGIVVLSGIMITLFAALFATNHYIRMKEDNLYRI